MIYEDKKKQIVYNILCFILCPLPMWIVILFLGKSIWGIILLSSFTLDIFILDGHWIEKTGDISEFITDYIVRKNNDSNPQNEYQST